MLKTTVDRVVWEPDDSGGYEYHIVRLPKGAPIVDTGDIIVDLTEEQAQAMVEWTLLADETVKWLVSDDSDVPRSPQQTVVGFKNAYALMLCMADKAVQVATPVKDVSFANLCNQRYKFSMSANAYDPKAQQLRVGAMRIELTIDGPPEDMSQNERTESWK